MKIILNNSTIGVARYTGLRMLSTANKKEIKSSGNIGDVQYEMYNADVYEVSEGQVIKIAGSGYYKSSQGIYATYNGEPSSSTLVSIVTGAASSYAQESVNATITIPAGVTRLVITRYVNTAIQPASADVYPLLVG